ncbi:MAG: glycoside hydrolase family 32 protein [Bacteroidales bacterium]|nr:glycoside hydrolase family 32 protein [Bacteroidales bacterium]
MFRTRQFTILLQAALLLAACGNDDPSSVIEIPTTPETPGTGGENPEGNDTPSDNTGLYTEQYRPQIHYTPVKNWVNDPNGMVYVDGTWHLFYQYNPYGNDWGNLSWGHATSTDLMHWKEQSTVLYRDALGDIFSGSAVVDKENTAGFGAGSVVALYTSAGEHQQQSIAYSNDKGMTFTTYNGNPVIGNTTRGDFRDPKVFWHEPSQQWVMSLALGWSHGIEFWTSKDLKSWTMASQFTTQVARCNQGQWECPDLFPLEYKGQQKWVLIVSVNPGGPFTGSGTMYFVGDFNGKHFTADALDYPLWADYGMDNYAGVTWSNAPDERKVFLGWMNNWTYAGGVPCSPWRSAFTLPRDLSLIEYQGSPLLSSKVSPEVETLAGSWEKAASGQSFKEASAYHIQATFPYDKASTLTLSNAYGEKYEICYNTIGHKISVERTSVTGTCVSSFSMPSLYAPVRTETENVTLDIFVDQSSVEVFTGNGSMAMTNLVFPQSIYNQIETSALVTETKYRTLKSIWNQK